MIGVFDSGYGGLSVLKGLEESFPEQSFIYLGDNARAPYGIRSKDIVEQYVGEATDWLFSHGANVVVLACNTASAEALLSVQEKFPKKHIIGVIEPTADYVKRRAESAEPVAVIATPSTIRSGAYRKALEARGFEKIIERAAPLLVPIVETGDVAGAMAEHVVRDALAPLTRIGLEHIILGCTHYYFLRETIEKLYPHLKLYDASESFPSYFKHFLKENGKIIKKEKSETKFYTTDEADVFARFVGERLGFSIKPEKIKL